LAEGVDYDTTREGGRGRGEMGRENESGGGNVRGDHERAWQRAWTMTREGKIGRGNVRGGEGEGAQPDKEERNTHTCTRTHTHTL
jgi:hypothetical protein